MRTTGTAGRDRGRRSEWHVRVRGIVCLLMLLAAGFTKPASAAEGKVYRCEREGSVVYTDIGCSLLPPVRLGRPVGTVDPLTEGERALLERMQQGTARTRSRARASANAKGAHCRANGGAEATCVAREQPSRRARAKSGKPRKIVSAPAPVRASSLHARRRAGAANGPPADGSAGAVRRVAPGRVAAP